MKTKRKYFKPEIELIRLDREISLQLASDANPEGEPDWSAVNHTTHFNNNPMQELNA
jgi:hypothetical protein